MRFSYNPETREVSIYVKQEEFDLAANGDEYRVFTRTFNADNLETFINGYTEFIKKICSDLLINEKIHDIITISTYKSGYLWRSLLDFSSSDESTSFLENILSYGLHLINQDG